MTTFEYLSIAYGLLFSAVALRLIGGLPHALNRTRGYRAHATAVILLLVGTVLNFWNFLQYRNVDWTLLSFAQLLATPGIIYFLTLSLVPDDPGAVDSWESFYFAKRTQFFSGMIAWGLCAALNTTSLLHMSPFHRQRVVHLGLIVIGAVGLSSPRPSVHRALGFVACAVVAISIAILFFGGVSPR